MRRLAELRGEKPFRDPRLERARDALGQARWHCLDRNVSKDIEEMRAALAEGGFTLADIDTTEKEVAELLQKGAKKRMPQEERKDSAHRYWQTVERVIAERSKRADITLKCFLKMLQRYEIELSDIDLTEQDITDAEERIQRYLKEIGRAHV